MSNIKRLNSQLKSMDKDIASMQSEVDTKIKYIKYASDKPSVCVTGDMRKIFHYNQNRALTVRELAKLQSFPDDFVFKGTRISQQQQVGNSVPPQMAAAIATTILKMAKNV